VTGLLSRDSSVEVSVTCVVLKMAAMRHKLSAADEELHRYCPSVNASSL